MPEMHFEIEWSDGLRETCYSPSLVIKDFFDPGSSYPLADFLERSRAALRTASARVQEKYGFPCSRALGQLASIEAAASRYAAVANAHVAVRCFHD